jgi:protein SPT2
VTAPLPSRSDSGAKSHGVSGTASSASTRLQLSNTKVNSPSVAQRQEKASILSAVPATNKPPKKGSYAEIMARAAEAAKVKKPAVETTAQKPKERISMKKELKMQKQTERLMKDQKFAPGTNRKLAQNGSKTNKDARSGPPQSGRKGSPNAQNASNGSTYQGTMKSKPKVEVSYKGTMKPRPESTKPRANKSPLIKPRPTNSPSRRYAEEDGYDYASEDYSDMDAGFDDVDEEEELALRQAKKDDDYEKMMLEELKRQKEAKKRRAAEMAIRERERLKGGGR